MLVFNGANLPPPLNVIYRERLHFTEIPLTLVFASHVVGAVTGLVFFERLSDQVGRRPVLFAALALSALSAALFPGLSCRSCCPCADSLDDPRNG